MLEYICGCLTTSLMLVSRTECLHEEVDKYPAEIIQFLKIMIMPTVWYG